eukprot:CAMPEP_0206162400 /NCGR_PEP_ID=MMETSP1474-20131121/9732_1 /ASSEMBLY_ACC=CAM_ASM_001110 /TAXON_ID=97495 /ORGANISM="Imantonia sp., Strain RCC918" /LENGTH=214 /DNA_ID=CAMNT_0053564661 /DNA_START=28 /DNA_END=673 /DNA_ORIENTATION=+
MASDQGFREAFTMFDQDQDNLVSQAELQKAASLFGTQLTDEEVRDIMKETSSGGGSLTFNDFSKLMGAGLKHQKKNDPEEDLKHAFSLFDLDRDGYISPQEMQQALARFGAPLTEREVDQLIGEATLSSERRVSFEVFKTVAEAATCSSDRRRRSGKQQQRAGHARARGRAAHELVCRRLLLPSPHASLREFQSMFGNTRSCQYVGEEYTMKGC